MESPQQNTRHKITINWPAMIALIVYPIALIIIALIYHINIGCTSKDLLIAVLGYYGSNITVGLSLHRLWSHGSYKTKPWVEFIFVLMSAGCLQGPALAWASDHKFHHAYADGDRDPHTPLKYSNKLKGLLWSHIGWMLFSDPSQKHIDRATFLTLGKKKMLIWQMKYYWHLAGFMNIVPPMLLGAAIYGELSAKALFAGFLFVGLGRALQQQATFCVNSVCHFIGSRQYVNDSSCDVWWMAPFLLGENWHNFHHAFGRDYRNGHRWYHFDVHKWLIWGMSKCGLAWDLNVTPPERIAATIAELQTTSIHPKLQLIGETAAAIAEVAADKASKLEMFLSCRTNISNNITNVNHIIYSEFSELRELLRRLSAYHISKAKRQLLTQFKQTNRKLVRLQRESMRLAEVIQKAINSSQGISEHLLSRSIKAMQRIETEAQRLGVVLRGDGHGGQSPLLDLHLDTEEGGAAANN